tara:strand:+ start:616 stop:951 length:336 start_codon:yes stop_codon:yes gene_type:complete
MEEFITLNSEEENIIIEKENIHESNEIDEENKEKNICIMINDIKELLKFAKMKKDYDNIILKYNIKITRKNKIVSPIREKIIIKKAIINFKINEPEDVFDYDTYMRVINTK